MKQCTKCLERKTLDQYTRSSTCNDGLRGDCKSCVSKYRAKYHLDHLERDRNNHRAYNESHKLEIAFSARRWTSAHLGNKRMATAKRRAITSDVIPSDTWDMLIVLYGERCMYPNCLEITKLELDHIIPVSKGGKHSFNNFQILCKYHNCSKGNRNSIDYRPV